MIHKNAAPAGTFQQAAQHKAAVAAADKAEKAPAKPKKAKEPVVEAAAEEQAAPEAEAPAQAEEVAE